MANFKRTSQVILLVSFCIFAQVNPVLSGNSGTAVKENDRGGADSADIKSPITCGAYVAPGVWKEFDCYNLAAVGKTTNDDPFTPSWRLIGGYWQWGRKGPDPSQWHDTNTEHFAHGPTGPGETEANDSSISNWWNTSKAGYARNPDSDNPDSK
jgi:hypothetical protein